MVRRAALTLLFALVVFAPTARTERDAREKLRHAPRMRFGIVAFDLNPPVPARLTELGVGLVRGSCRWDVLEPARGRFDWFCADNVIFGADRLHLRSYMTVDCVPGWANGGAGCAVMPADIEDWYNFVANFVTRYRHFETVLGVWNEPNLSELKDTPDGAGYARLFINASSARTLVDPDFPIAGPETSHHALASGYLASSLDTIERFRAFAPQDVIAVHWYPDGPPLVDYMDQVHALIDREIWLTESGFTTPDPVQQSAFFTDLLTTFRDARRPWWTHVVFYRLWDGRDCCSEAILTGDFSPRPAFDTFRDWLLSHPDDPPGDSGRPEQHK